MDLNETLGFVHVVTEGSFTAAGRRLGIPKSTLSRQVSRLEDRLGVRLMHRSTRKLSLTDTGRAYFERCKGAIAELEDAERVAMDVAGEVRGHLRVTTAGDVGERWLAGLLPRFRARYPEVSFELLITSRRVDLVGEGYDLAIRGGPMPTRDLVARVLVHDTFALYASPAWIEAHGAPETLEALEEHGIVAVRAPFPWPVTGPEGERQLTERYVLATNSPGMAARATAEGLGVGFLLRLAAQRYLTRGQLVRVLPEYELSRPDNALRAVYPSRHHLSPKVRAFVDFLVEHVDRIGD